MTDDELDAAMPGMKEGYEVQLFYKPRSFELLTAISPSGTPSKDS